MEKIRFIHAADIHLGSFLHIAGEIPENIQRVFRTATMDAFKRICDAAIRHQVDFIVISGDLYDREARSVAACRLFAEECKRLNEAGIPVYVIAGNHDPLREQPYIFELPQNVKVFGGNEPEAYPVSGKDGQTIARVIGQSYLSRAESRRMHLNYHCPDRGIWNIGLLHTQLDLGSSTYVPCSLPELKEKNDIHYWALGHIHKPQLLTQSIPVISYSGIPQGRDFGEDGIGGCILVELDPLKDPKLSFIPTSSVVFKRVEVWIDEDPNSIPETIPGLEDKISALADQLIKESYNETGGIPFSQDETSPIMGYVVQWVIKGRGKIHDLLMEQQDEASREIVQELRRSYQGTYPFLWTDSVYIRTEKVLPDRSKYEHTPFFRELNKVVQECIASAPMKKQLIHEMGQIWDERGDHENIDDYCFLLDEETYEEIIENAIRFILEKLLEEEEGL
jgi:exonuclease SbcD